MTSRRMNLGDGGNAIDELHEAGRGAASPLQVSTTMVTAHLFNLSCCSSRSVGAQQRCAGTSIDGFHPFYRETVIGIGT